LTKPKKKASANFPENSIEKRISSTKIRPASRGGKRRAQKILYKEGGGVSGKGDPKRSFPFPPGASQARETK